MKSNIEQSEFLAELLSNKKKLENNQSVSDCGIRAPRISSSQNKRTGIARELAFTLFPPADSQKKADRIYSYIRYSQLISLLAQAYKHQEKQKEDERVRQERENDRYRQARVYGNRKIFESLLDEPMGESILHPVPMPVEIASLEELTPFFSRMSENKQAKQACEVYKRGAYYDDGRIDMCKQVPGPTHIGKMIRSIRENPHIKHFLMGNSIVGLEGAREISNYLLIKPNIETWYLAGNCIDTEGIHLISESLKQDRCCKALWLKRNPLMSVGVRSIGEMLETNHTIEILDLSNVGCMDDGVQYLFESLKKNKGVRILYLDANGITEKGAEYIAQYFEYLAKHKKSGLTSLFVGINRLGDKGAIRIAKAIRDYHPLQGLEIASNRIQASGLSVILDAVQNLPKMIYLDLGLYKSTSDMKELPNYFDQGGVEKIVEFIRNNRTVHILSIQDTNIGPEGVAEIIDAVRENDTLRFVYMGQYGYCTPKQLSSKLWSHLDKNCMIHEGVDVQTYRRDKIRLMKHTERVKDIDSIYRNNM